MNKKTLIVFTLCILSLLPVSGATFTEPELKALLLSNNLKLQQAIGEQELSLLDSKDAKTGYGPTLDLTISATYLQNTELITIPGSPALTPPLSTLFPMRIEMEPTLYNFSLSLTQPVWTWGKLKNGVAMTEKLSEIRQAQKFALQKSLLAELQSRLYAQQYLSRMEDLLDEQLHYSHVLVSLVQESFANNLVLEEDVLAASVSERQIELAKVQVAQQETRQRSAIGQLCNITLSADDELAWEPDEKRLVSLLGYDLKTLQALATAKSQEQVRIATLMGDLASLATSLAKGDLYWKPDVAMQVSLEYGGSKFPVFEASWDTTDDYTFNVSVGMKTTLWDGGKKFHEVRRKAIGESQAHLDMAQVYQAILSQVEQAYLTLHLAHENLAYLRLKGESLEAEVAQQQLLFDSGYGSEADLLKAKLASLSARFETEQQWLSYTGSFVTITTLCGVENPLL
ncbi:MAG: TolC family protein [Sphaerochaeta sp.]|nr:TolC family protein [Sphaerochaeta sp.]